MARKVPFAVLRVRFLAMAVVVVRAFCWVGCEIHAAANQEGPAAFGNSAEANSADGSGAESSAISFRTDVLPILTKAGCNAGACHGAATGQGGFRLSLLGYDPEEDHARITREFSGRRIDPDVPSESLFLRKPTRQVEHDGGRRIKPQSNEHEALLHWIAKGAPYGDPDLHVIRLDVRPDAIFSENPEAHVQLEVTAVLSDGSSREVTGRALYSSNDDAIAEAGSKGRVAVRSRGVTSIVVRYSGQVAAVRVAVPLSPAESLPPDFGPHNFIDEIVRTEFARLRLDPSPLTGDAEFLRRVYLDLAGRLPDPEHVRTFLAEPPSQAKRARIIDELVGSEAFTDFWTLKLADLLLVSGKRGTEEATRAYHDWLREQVAQNTGWDAMAGQLLTATGNSTESGPANFFQRASDPRDLAELASSMFLGTQLACARCHAHPSDRWTQDDYYQFAAYFARVTREGNQVKTSDRGELEHPKTRRPVAPAPLGALLAEPSGADRRVQLAEWLTAPENPFFAQAMVNRVWQQLLGRGLVEPVDDLRPTNPAAHPALLDALARDFAGSGFDLRRLITTIANSRTYQLSSRANPVNRHDDRLFSRAYLKPLPPQVFMDAVAQVTGVPDAFEGYPAGTRAVQLVGAQTPSYALDVLGRCSREQSCESSGNAGGGLAQALHLINGSTLNDKLGSGLLGQWRAINKSTDEIIAELYLRALSRLPSPSESAEWERRIGRSPHPREVLEDLLWVLLNCREFAFNH